MKKRVRLTEQQLHRVISASVKRILNEIGDTDRGQRLLGHASRMWDDEHPGQEGYDKNPIERYSHQKRVARLNKEKNKNAKSDGDKALTQAEIADARTERLKQLADPYWKGYFNGDEQWSQDREINRNRRVCGDCGYRGKMKVSGNANTGNATITCPECGSSEPVFAYEKFQPLVPQTCRISRKETYTQPDKYGGAD